MAWANIDDQSAFHAKVLAVGNSGWGALCRMIAWSCAHGTDGHIPKHLLHLIANTDEQERIFSVGLLEQNEDGSAQIHDFLEWNLSAKQVKQSKEKRAKAGQIGGLRSGSKRQASAEAHAQALASTTDEANANPIHSTPLHKEDHRDPESKTEGGSKPKPPGNLTPSTGDKGPKPGKASKEPKAPKGKRSMPPDFAVSDAIRAICRTEGLPDPDVVIENFRDTSLAKGYKYIDWEAAFRNWMRSDITRRIYPAQKPSTPGFIDGLPILRHPDREKMIPKPGEVPDLTGLFGDET